MAVKMWQNQKLTKAWNKWRDNYQQYLDALAEKAAQAKRLADALAGEHAAMMNKVHAD